MLAKKEQLQQAAKTVKGLLKLVWEKLPNFSSQKTDVG